jgi:hypothetical protein
VSVRTDEQETISGAPLEEDIIALMGVRDARKYQGSISSPY